MTTMIVEVYDALKAAGAPEDKAQAAATVLAIRDERFERIDQRFDELEAKLGARIDNVEVKLGSRIDNVETKLTGQQLELAALRAELAMLKWIVGSIGFGVLLLVVKAFIPVG